MPEFRSDCSNCCGLCCVAPAQLSTQAFAFDKPLDTPCRHLDEQHRCRIHDARPAHGYAGCETFECYGAGQWITQHLFNGAAWTDSEELAAEMFAAYRHWLPRFEAAAMIEAALPYVDADAQSPLATVMQTLTSEEENDLPADGQSLRDQVLQQIRSAMGERHAVQDDATPIRLLNNEPN